MANVSSGHRYVTQIYPSGFSPPYESPFLPGRLPDNWLFFQRPKHDHGRAVPYFQREDGLGVALSVDKQRDGNLWIHVGIDRIGGVPTEEDVILVKNLFIGRSRYAIRVFPSEGNDNPDGAIHLWCRVLGHPLPDLRVM